MRFAITGATGFIGGRLARLLVFDGHEVVALVRDPARAQGLMDLGVDVVQGNVTSRSSLEQAFRGADGVYHVAGWYRIGTPEADEAWAVNVQGTRNVMDAAWRAGVPRVIHTSTIAVNSDTQGLVRDEDYVFTGKYISLYEQTKAEAHRIAQRYARDGLDVVIVMPGAVYGAGDTSQLGELIRQTAQGRRVLAPAGLGLCMAHVDDVAHGHVQAMNLGEMGSSYMLAGPQTTAVEVLRTVADLTGGPYPRVIPDGVLRVGARVMSVAGGLPLPATANAESLRVSRATYLGSPAKAQRDLEWSARGLREGLAQTIREEMSEPGTMVP